MTQAMIAAIPSVPTRVLLTLMRHRNGTSGQCNPSLRLLATETEETEQHISRAIDSLEKKGFVKRIRLKGGTKDGSRIQYELNSPLLRIGSSPEVRNSAGQVFTTSGRPYSPHLVSPIRNVTKQLKQDVDVDEVGSENEEARRAKSFLEANGASRSQLRELLNAESVTFTIAWVAAFDSIGDSIRNPFGFMVEQIRSRRMPPETGDQSDSDEQLSPRENDLVNRCFRQLLAANVASNNQADLRRFVADNIESGRRLIAADRDALAPRLLRVGLDWGPRIVTLAAVEEHYAMLEAELFPHRVKSLPAEAYG